MILIERPGFTLKGSDQDPDPHRVASKSREVGLSTNLLVPSRGAVQEKNLKGFINGQDRTANLEQPGEEN